MHYIQHFPRNSFIFANIRLYTLLTLRPYVDTLNRAQRAASRSAKFRIVSGYSGTLSTG